MTGIAFNASFNTKQKNALAELFNNFRVFQPGVDADTVGALFACKLAEPLTVRNARLLCFIMDCLSQQLLITSIWQTVAQQSHCFVSVKGRPLTRNTLSSAKYCAIRFGTIEDAPIIRAYIDILKSAK